MGYQPPPSFLSCDRLTVKHILLCSQSLIFLIAFSSLYWQIPGLYGENGLIPVAPKLDFDGPIWECSFPILLSIYRYLNLVPSRALQLLCLIGIVLSFITACKRQSRSPIIYLILTLLYLNAQKVGGIFLWYQWDTLLIETGFHMTFLAALPDSALDSIGIFLVNWLMCRLMFASGVVKLQSNCPAWWSLTAVVIHYESQCVPTPFAWYFHNMPVWFKRLSTSLTFYIEIYQPLAFLLPISCLKKFVFLQQALLMVLIILSGNYNFFNILIIVICIPMLERGRHVEWFSSRTDMFLSLIIGIVLTAHYMYWFDVKLDIFGLQVTTEIAFNRQQLDAIVTKTTYFVVCLGIFMFVVTVTYAIYNYWTTDPASRSRKLFYCLLAVGVATPLFTISIVPFVVIDREVHDSIPETLRNFYYRIDPYQIVNPYGLFRTMTGLNGRPEVIVEGAADPNGPWKEFSFYSKPGNVSQAPIFVLPHQPRLDWQLWFAALGSYRYNPFFLSLTYHLMEDTPEVLRLMSRPQPFKETPRYIRAQLYHYHYTTPGEKVDWWTRELQYEYMPTFPKRDEVLVDYLKRSGLLLTKEYDTTNILDLLLLRLHSFVYAIDQAIFVWGMVTSCLIIIAHKFLSSFIPFGLFSLPNV